MIDGLELRRFVYDEILATGHPPRAERIGREFGTDRQSAVQALRGLDVGKTVLVHPTTGEIWMAGPFSAGRTTYEIIGAKQRWWANCAWDMFGVAVIVNEPVRFEATCAHCDEQFTITGDPAQVATDWLIHFLVPARRWYDDIGFT
jgi:Alkylmercury lyase